MNRKRQQDPDTPSPEEMRRKFFIGFGIVMVGIVLAIVAFNFIVPRVVRLVTGEAVFAGRGTSYWEEALAGKDKKLKQNDAANALTHDQAVPVLVQLIESDDVGVRRQAARTLSRVRSKAASSALKEAQKDSDSQVRCYAAYALAVTDPQSGEASIPLLLEATLIPDRGIDIVEAVNQVLEQFPVPARVTGCIETLKHADIKVRVQAIKHLGGMGAAAQDAVPALIDQLKVSELDEEGFAVADRAVAALVKINPQARAQAVQKYLPVLQNDAASSADRIAAAIALGRLRDAAKEAVPTLLQLRKSKDPKLAQEAQNALRAIDLKAAEKP